MILKEIIDRTKNHFEAKNFDSPRLDAELILAHGLGLGRMDLYLKFDSVLTNDELTKCRELVSRRSQGEPVAYIVGEKGFYTDVFKVNASVLVPRPETELIVDEVLKLKADYSDSPAFIDIGTGSGCLGLSILKHIESSSAHLVDISTSALEVCQENAGLLELSGRCKFHDKDFGEIDFGEETFDFIVSNPPYIDRADPDIQESVKAYEPDEALFSDEEGFAHIKSWAEKSLRLLKPGGRYFFEIGAQQGQKSVELMKTIGYSGVELLQDLSGKDRVLICKKD